MITEDDLYDACSDYAPTEKRLDEFRSCLLGLDVNRIHDISDPFYGDDIMYSRTALNAACERGRIEMVELLLTHPEIDVNKKGSDDMSPLHEACFNGNDKIVSLLLQHKRILPNEQCGGTSPLKTAVDRQHMGVVELILAMVEDVTLFHIDSIVHPAYRIFKEFNYGNRHVARRNLLKKKGIPSKHDSAQVFLLLILCNNGYFKLSDSSSTITTTSVTTKEIRNNQIIKITVTTETQNDPSRYRFFKIAFELPMELQMRLCNLLFEQKKEFVSESLVKLELEMLQKEKFLS